MFHLNKNIIPFHSAVVNNKSCIRKHFQPFSPFILIRVIVWTTTFFQLLTVLLGTTDIRVPQGQCSFGLSVHWLNRMVRQIVNLKPQNINAVEGVKKESNPMETGRGCSCINLTKWRGSWEPFRNSVVVGAGGILFWNCSVTCAVTKSFCGMNTERVMLFFCYRSTK